MQRFDTYFHDFFTFGTEEIKQRAKIQSSQESNEDLLKILSLDLLVADNAKSHNTGQYEQTFAAPIRSVLRRGQTFKWRIVFDRPIERKRDGILLDFSFGTDPKPEKSTQQLLRVWNPDYQLDWKWGAKFSELNGVEGVIEIMPSATCPVGEWKFQIHCGRLNSSFELESQVAYSYKGYLFILFNPWCPDDLVYMEDQEDRDEYVLNDSGAVWTGSKYGQYNPVAWNFAQFEDVVLYSALYGLRRSPLEDNKRYDPAMMARTLTHVVANQVLQGRWQEPYDSGTKPWEWTGSFPILEKFIQGRCEAVKYAQCWVFSGVLTSLCRTLGIPCRSVTNLSSAHDTDHTLTIDEKYVRNGLGGTFELLEKTDSIWNFHVWNEAYMRRGDLPPGNDGWQAIDATPQERSEGKYQCGPMSIKAIRRGEVKLNYDGWFIFGEVNADVAKWFYERDTKAPGGLRLLRYNIDTMEVGKVVITSHKRNAMKPWELTDYYKPTEGSSEERVQIKRAVKAVVSNEREEILKLFGCDESTPHLDDVNFTFTDLDILQIGDSATVRLQITNANPMESRTITTEIQIFILRDNGIPDAKIASLTDKQTLRPNEGGSVELTISAEDYVGLVKEHNSIVAEVITEVDETGQIFSDRDTFLVQKGGLSIQPCETAILNSPKSLTISFTNPTNVVLTDIEIQIEGCGLARQVKLKGPKEIPGRGQLDIQHDFLPKRLGKRTILALFNSKQLSNIRSTQTVTVVRST